MSRRPATVVQADIRRIMRSAKAEGVAVVIEIPGANGKPLIIRINPSDGTDKALDPGEEIVL